MKIRQGFVSNSSSSSYVIITTDQIQEKVEAKLPPYAYSLMHALEKKRCRLDGQPVTLIEVYSHGDGGTLDELKIPGEASLAKTLEKTKYLNSTDEQIDEYFFQDEVWAIWEYRDAAFQQYRDILEAEGAIVYRIVG